jgi:NAD(P)-dependent dehydrogenase (short-subunit alcohol dehydrogenase family)
MFDLTGKTALVTGASGGIGGAIAKALHAQGATVILSGTRAEALEAVKAELGSRAFIAPPTCPILPRSKRCPRRRKKPQAPASTSWSTMPASPATISSCA